MGAASLCNNRNGIYIRLINIKLYGEVDRLSRYTSQCVESDSGIARTMAKLKLVVPAHPFLH